MRIYLQVRFSQKRTKMRAQARTKKIEELKALGQVPCEGSFLTYLHRVHTDLEDLVDLINEPQQSTRPQAIQFFLCGLELSFSLSFEKTSSVQ